MTKRVFVDEVEYDVDNNNEIVGLACGCYACDGGIQPGHFLCSCPPAVALQAERDGVLIRSDRDAGWKWYLNVAENRV